MFTQQDLWAENLIRSSIDKGKSGLLKFTIDETLFQEACRPWEGALVIKVLGTSVGFLTLKERLGGIWKLQGTFDLIGVGHGCFVGRFALEEDREKVINGGPLDDI